MRKRILQLLFGVLLVGACLPVQPQAVYIPSRQNDLVDAKIVTSYSALKAVRPYAPGTRAFTAGKAAQGDGGAGWWYYDAADTTTAEDGVKCLTSTVAGATGRWKRADDKLTPTGATINVLWAGAKADGVDVEDAAMTAGSNNVTSASINATSADIGKPVFVRGAGAEDIDYAGTYHSVLGTITAVPDAHTLTVSVAASHSVTGAHLMYGTDNNAAIQAAVAALPENGTLLFPAGNYWCGRDANASNQYAFQLLKRKNITIRGEGGAKLIDAFDYAYTHSYVLRLVGCENIGVTGLAFDIGLTGYSAARVNMSCITINDYLPDNTPSRNVNISNCWFRIRHSRPGTHNNNQGLFGVYVVNSDTEMTDSNNSQVQGTYVTNCTWDNSWQRPVEFQGCRDFLVSDSKFLNIASGGIGSGVRIIYGSSRGRVVNNYCTVDPACPETGLNVEFVYLATPASPRAITHDIEIAGNQYECKSDRSSFRNCGIYVSVASDIYIHHNTFVFNAATALYNANGIYLLADGNPSPRGSSNFQIDHNRFEGWTEGAIRCVDTLATNIRMGSHNVYGTNNATGLPIATNVYYNNIQAAIPADNSETWRGFGATGKTANLIINSEDPTATGWARGGVNVTLHTNATTDPSGGNNAVFVDEDSSLASEHKIQPNNLTVTAGTVYTFRALVKDAGRRYVYMYLGSASFGTTQAVAFDLQQGVIKQLSSGNPTYDIRSAGGGWYWCSLTAKATVTGGVTVVIDGYKDGTTQNYDGVPGTGFYFAGAAFYAGGMLPYAPTAGSVAAGYGVMGQEVRGGNVSAASQLTLGSNASLVAAGNIVAPQDYTFAPTGSIWKLKAQAPSDALFQWDFTPTGLTNGSAQVRFFRDLNNYAAANSYVQVLKGDGTATYNNQLAGTGTTALAADNGNLLLSRTGGSIGVYGQAATARPAASADVPGALANIGWLTSGGSYPYNANGGNFSNIGTYTGTGTFTLAPAAVPFVLHSVTAPADALTQVDQDITGVTTAAVQWRFFRHTNNAASSNSYVQVLKGNNSATINWQIAGTGTSYACADNGNFGVGVAVGTSLKSKVQVNGTVSSAVSAPTYGTTVTINASAGNFAKITVTNGTAFTLAAPTNVVAGQWLTLDIVNSSGGAMGAITWNAVWLKDGSYANPANGKRRTGQFYYDGSNWIQVGTWSGDL